MMTGSLWEANPPDQHHARTSLAFANLTVVHHGPLDVVGELSFGGVAVGLHAVVKIPERCPEEGGERGRNGSRLQIRAAALGSGALEEGSHRIGD